MWSAVVAGRALQREQTGLAARIAALALRYSVLYPRAQGEGRVCFLFCSRRLAPAKEHGSQREPSE